MSGDRLTTKIRDWFRDHDMFGHSIALNFQKQGDTYNTSIGGFFSTIIKIVFSIYIYLIFKRMVLIEGTENTSVSSTLDLTKEPELNYAETRI